MTYSLAKNCWSGINRYDNKNKYIEQYTPRVTMPYSDWINYVSKGNNVLLGSGGIIPSGTVNTVGGLNGAVYSGTVRQGW